MGEKLSLRPLLVKPILVSPNFVFRVSQPPRGLHSNASPSSFNPVKTNVRPASSAVEDYLEQILELINTKGYARVVDIAQRLSISQASVTNMVQKLDAEGLLKYEKYRGLVLTTAGEALALNITHRHKLLTDFLQLLGLDERTIYHDVEGMEHHVSPATVHAIESLTRQLKRQPALLQRVREGAPVAETKAKQSKSTHSKAQ
jgi:Mn-dependent DtxR family transcriptional regulator